MSKPEHQEGPAILLVAGEASGDTHGAELIRCLRQQQPNLRCLGAGGSRMAAAGQTQLFDLTQHAVVGLIEVFKHYPKFRSLFNKLVRLAEATQPAAVVLIDFPGFNLRLAAKLRKLLPRTKIIYYISPQVWAWKGGRAQTMAKILDLLLVIFDFEKKWYAEKAPQLKVEWVGHPLFDRILSQKNAKPAPDLSRTQQVVALLPGSRVTELRKHLPILIATAKILYNKRRNLRFVWIAPDADLLEKGQKILREIHAESLPLETYVGYQLSHLHRCDLALLASGSVSLECAAVGLPQIVFYKVHPLTYQIGRMVVKIKYLSMVNLIANKPLVPELIQHNLKAEDLAAKALELLSHPEQRRLMNENISKVMEHLGQPGASAKAARLILQQMSIDTPALVH